MHPEHTVRASPRISVSAENEVPCIATATMPINMTPAVCAAHNGLDGRELLTKETRRMRLVGKS